MKLRHGDWPLHIPPDRGSEDWLLYEAISSPLESCAPDCDALCVCPGEHDEDWQEAA